MRRFPPRDLPPRDRRPKREPLRREVPRGEGPFDRLLRSRPQRDPAPFIIGGTVGFLAIAILLLFTLSGLFGGDGEGGQIDGEGAGIRFKPGKMPALPGGLVALSDFVVFEAEDDVTAAIGLPLNEQVEDPAGVGFYTFLDRRWQKVADVQIADGGRRAEADFSPVPQNLVVLRLVAQTYQVGGSLPPGGRLRDDAKVGILSPRDYTPGEDGSIQGQATDLQVPENVLVIPTIVGSRDDSAEIINDILDDESLRQQHRDAIVQLVKNGGFAGIDLEYSAVDPALGPVFTEFVESLADALHGSQKRLSLTLPPPAAEGQRQAYEWGALGDAADIVKILPLADPVLYREGMPEALADITAEVDPKKVMLVVSPFSVERSPEGTKPIGYLEAMLIASEIKVQEPADLAEVRPAVRVVLVAKNLAQSEGASGLRWSDEAAAVTFAFGGAESRTVFLENAFSMGFKLELVQAFGLGGVFVSDASAGADVASIWPTLNQFVEAGTIALVRPNDDTLVPRWDAPDGGDLGGGAGNSTTWIAPNEPKPYNLVLIVSDGDKRFGRRLPLEVKGAPQTAPTPLVTFPREEATPSPGATPSPTPPASALPMQVGKRVDADRDGSFSDSESTSPGSEVEYRIVIDNDSGGPVTITSLVDSKYPGIVCRDTDGNNVVGRALAADDGDGGNVSAVDELGPDAVACKFTATVPPPLNDPFVNDVTVVVRDAAGKTGTDHDTATVTKS